jgi:high-affinity Fe2+/Pb2+ permease
MNIVRQEEGVPWSDPAVWISGLLVAWVVAAVLFNGLYRPARQGRKVAYLTVASFVVLMLVLGIVWSSSQHAAGDAPRETRNSSPRLTIAALAHGLRYHSHHGASP